MNDRALNTIIIISVAYVAMQMLADITSLKIAYVAGFSIDAGTLVYPFTFTLRDLLHKLTNLKTTRVLIISAAVINLLMALLFKVAAELPADPEVGPQLAFASVLAPVWRIVIASIIAEVIAELVDAEVYQAFVNRLGSRHQWGRVLTSNAISVPLDSALFVVIAFAGDLPGAVVWSIFSTNIIVKGAVTLVSMPWIYLVKGEPASVAPSRA